MSIVDIEDIFSLHLKPSEVLEKFFPVGAKFKVGCFKLITLNFVNDKIEMLTSGASFRTDNSFTFEVREVTNNNNIPAKWLVGLDTDSGKLCGAPVFTFTTMHHKGEIEIEMEIL